MKKELKSSVSQFISEEFEAIKSNIRTDKCYSLVLIDCLKLFLGLTSKFATYREQDTNKYFGQFQGFDFIEFIPEIEEIFKLIYENEFNINKNQIVHVKKSVPDKIQESHKEEHKEIEEMPCDGIEEELVTLSKRENNQFSNENETLKPNLKKINKINENDSQIENDIFVED